MIEFDDKIKQGLASIYLLFKIYESNDIELINASVLNERYDYTNLPVSVEWDSITNEIKWL